MISETENVIKQLILNNDIKGYNETISRNISCDGFESLTKFYQR